MKEILCKPNLEKSISEIKERNIFKMLNIRSLMGAKSLKIINIEVEEKTGEISAAPE